MTRVLIKTMPAWLFVCYIVTSHCRRQDENRFVTRTGTGFRPAHLFGVRARFHIQMLKPPKKINASTLGHKGIG
jgi:hypothetical protein